MSTDLRQLSEREREILELVATGLSNQQIANHLGVSVNTVKVHLRNIFGKIGATSRTEATMYAVRTGLISVDGGQQADPQLAGRYSVPTPTVSVEPDAQTEAHDEEIAPITQVAPVSDLLAPETINPVRLPSQIEIADAPVMPRQVTAATSMPIQTIGDVADLPAEATAARRTPFSKRVLLAAVALSFIAVAAIFGLFVWRNPSTTSVGPRNDSAENTRRWQEQPRLPSQRAFFATASIDTYLYVIGGEDTQGVVGRVERFDPQNQTWTALSKKPTPVSDVRAATIARVIYVPGGRRSASQTDIADIFEAYDPRTDTWTRLPNLPAPRSGYGLAAVEGKLYLLGGWDGKGYSNEVFEFDPGTKRWSKRTPMPTARAYLDVGVVDGNLYILGGENQSGALSTNEQYIPSAEGRQPWNTRAPLPEPRSRFGAAVALNLIHVVGGAQAGLQSLQYNVRTDAWQTFQNPPQELGSGPGVIQNDVLVFALGGKQSGGSYSDRMFSYYSFYNLVFPQINSGEK